jgi:hypothetical protein
VSKIVERLEHCRQTGDGEWIARCPAHADKSPSLTIKELPDGRTLLHCFAGCGALDVITAIGLEWSDLFPPDDNFYSPVSGRPRKQQTVDELVVEIAKADRAAGKLLSYEDRDREAEAFARLILREAM